MIKTCRLLAGVKRAPALAVSLAAAAALPLTSAHAFQFDALGGKGFLDSTIAVGIGIRAEDSSSRLQSQGNDNFPDAGDVYSTPLTGTHDFGVDWDGTGFFTRLTYLYDYTIDEEDDIDDAAKDLAGADISARDYFVYTGFDLLGRRGNFRLGNQVVSWGESTFIQGGINVINPFDVAKLRAPGSELKEALLPARIAWLSYGLTPMTTMEAFYQFYWERVEADPVGTYFSTRDFVGNGSGDEGIPISPLLPAIARGADQIADDGGEFGVKLSRLIPALDYSEVSLYYLNYHSRLPFLTASPVTAFLPSPPFPPGTPDTTTARYFFLYPENIRLWGASLSTQVGETAIQGEVSYRENEPIANDSAAIIGAAAAGGVPEPFDRRPFGQVQGTATRLFGRISAIGADQTTAVLEAGYSWLPTGRPDGYDHLTSHGWGLQGQMSLDYFDVWRSIAMTPRLALGWDVDGYLGQFIEDRKSASVGVTAKYLDTWSVDVAYTDFWGAEKSSRPANQINALHDRDFIAANFKYFF